ncbi:DegT/DnrJ/EryC1/StrS family aminotransferase [Crossiella sp. CA-258035]|uniref:DegT/DnrJ/EryC1/StrS family aminotransferase n=1 Tax=Crossiella sp. CA-258035 TaxID=2981138 RepID=UPI0024BCADBD|nr:DegT/DnrJ/EryC1/StrS family aminotransferase [Crossiella sp. CA-258035]WHT22858.1 DegT/DnrJ/EryC1/StrS family aminotransferase [Crossiella sp. CA-258035]
MAALSSPAHTAVPFSGTVPFFSQSASFQQLWPLISSGVEQVVAHGKYSHGRQVAELEQALCAYTGARFALGVNSGTDALVLLLRAAGLAPGEEVLVPAYTFIASASAVVLAGGRPVFVDVEPETYAMDPAALAAAITPRSRFVMPVHLFCQLADLDGIGAVARRAGLTVVEDSAEAIGMRWGGRHAGLLGAGGVLSFFPTKTLGALGDAGAVLTDDPGIAERVAALRHHGRGGRTLDHFPGISNETGLSGMNSKMDDLQAAVLLAKLTRLDADIARRGELAARYSARLSRILGITRLPTVITRNTDTVGAYYVYLIEGEDRDGLARHLAARGIETETYYPTPLPFQPCFAHLGHRRGDFPVAEAAAERALALPLYPDLTFAQLDRVCAAVEEFYTGGAR